MTKITNYYDKKRLAQQLQDELKQLEEDKELKREMEFKEKLEGLMEEFGKSASQILDVMRVIDPKVENKMKDSGSGSDGRQGTKRRLKRYTNPHTGDVVETRGGNNNQLKEWKNKYGDAEVKSWVETVD